MCIRDSTYVEPKAEQNITKNGTGKIESLEQEITYNIAYTARITAVSYTHLDVYKRQVLISSIMDNSSNKLAYSELLADMEKGTVKSIEIQSGGEKALVEVEGLSLIHI